MALIAAHLNAESFWRWQCKVRYSLHLSPPPGSVPASTSLETTWIKKVERDEDLLSHLLIPFMNAICRAVKYQIWNSLALFLSHTRSTRTNWYQNSFKAHISVSLRARVCALFSLGNLWVETVTVLILCKSLCNLPQFYLGRSNLFSSRGSYTLQTNTFLKIGFIHRRSAAVSSGFDITRTDHS